MLSWRGACVERIDCGRMHTEECFKSLNVEAATAILTIYLPEACGILQSSRLALNPLRCQANILGAVFYYVSS
jgi:hypothetical protein